ncbi:MAG: NAD-dependent epimerase [Burkholderiales bacterium]
MKILVTGAAGFIGSHVALALLRSGFEVVGIDNLNHYYDVRLKQARLARLMRHKTFSFVKSAIEDSAAVRKVFLDHRPDRVVHLAAQAGVRHSIDHPEEYVSSNIVGFFNILEACRRHAIEHLVYASTSSVYGASRMMPFSEHAVADHPVSFYAATKKANEAMAHSYAYLYGLPCTGLRFFTVYGPWGRPDMAYYKFTESILAGRPIKVFNFGNMARDFTYVDDIVQGIVRILDIPATPDAKWNSQSPDPASSCAPYRIYNIGNSNPTNLMYFIKVIENCLGKKAVIAFEPMQSGDVLQTYADTSELAAAVGLLPGTPVEVGIQQFVEWYLKYTRDLVQLEEAL